MTSTTNDTLDRRTTGHGIEQVAIVLLGVMFLPAGVQAAFFPRSFYDDFPVNRGWISATGGAYNEHLVRDVGALFLALAIVSLWAWWRPTLCLPVAVAWLVVGSLHLIFHFAHLERFDGADAVALVVSLVIVPVLAITAIVADHGGRPTL